jgi:hypothetical protein
VGLFVLMKILTRVNGGKAADRPQKINFYTNKKAPLLLTELFEVSSGFEPE